MKEIQVASGRGQYYGNVSFAGRHPLTLHSTTSPPSAAPLALAEQYYRNAPVMVRQDSLESTYESQLTPKQSISEVEGEGGDDDDDDDDEDEDELIIGFGSHLKRRLFDAFRRRMSRDADGGGGYGGGKAETFAPGNLQTLKAVAALAAVAGGMGGGAADPEKTAANGNHLFANELDIRRRLQCMCSNGLPKINVIPRKSQDIN